ncbi:MAG TPA: beta-agarase [Luteibacter sp.]|jgi:hypothetical protein|nr:beta-agarase [Luteibacter sp.]
MNPGRHLLLATLVSLAACSHADMASIDLAHPDRGWHVQADSVQAGSVLPAADGVAQAPFAFQPAALPRLTVTPASGDWNWSGKRTLHLRVQNGMPWAVTLVIEIADRAQGRLRTTVGIPAGPPQTLALPLAATSPRAFGMQAGPPMPFDAAGKPVLVATAVDGTLDTAHVASVSLSMPSPNAAQTLLFGKLDVSGEDDVRRAYTGIVDSHGQYTRATWPEKASGDDALKTPPPKMAVVKGIDRYGGRMDMPATKASGWFRTEKRGSRWWLVTPEGHAFFSLGVNAVVADGGRTYVEGREYMFTGLPKADGAFAAFYGSADSRSDQGSQRDNGLNHGRWFDFYAANLYRAFGTDWANAWRQRTLDRLTSWSFNTLGNWSDPALPQAGRIAYTVPVLIAGDYNTVSTGYDYWGRMPDPFDPRFVDATRKAVAVATKRVRDDPWLLGYFADNELAWAGMGPQGRWALAVGSLKQGPQSPAKQAFVAQLRQKYGDAGKLAVAWGVSIASWEQLLAADFAAPEPSEAKPAIVDDYVAFLRLYADTYFHTVADELKRADPHHLFLGGRLAVRTPEVEAACAQWCDVVSINMYTDLPEHGFDVAAFRKLDKPVLISEFHFGSADRGPFGSGVAAVASEGERGKAYAKFVDAATASGVVVGTHWFEYVDQPVTGRVLDGENSHIGLVGITDVPFGDFVRDVRAVNRHTMGLAP